MKLYCYLQGGIGNQMFQYAKGLSVLNQNNDFDELILDTSIYENQKRKVVDGGVTGREYDLDVFNTTHTTQEKWSRPNAILQGYFQHLEEFKDVEDQIKKEFTFKDDHITDEIKKLGDHLSEINSVSLHVRRGDYIKNPTANSWHGVMDKEYFDEAMSIMDSKVDSPVYYVFSEDIDWCKENIKAKNIVYLDDNFSGYKDSGHLYLMTRCNYHIMSNSSYSWWGSFLGNSKLTIGPKKWLANGTGSDIMLEDWIKI
tara:strand:+ start:314 stop:1081 length:768 start_codon:yes stop_codon:yes gene_type:complete